jgi:CTP synthase
MLFLEANRVMKVEHPDDVLHLHVSYLPLPPMLGEMKSKPVQMSVHLLNTSGINPDFIIARSERGIDDVRKEKLSHYCVVPEDQIISAPDIKSIYEVPINFEKDDLGKKIVSRLGLKVRRKKLYDRWYEMFENSKNQRKK